MALYLCKFLKKKKTQKPDYETHHPPFHMELSTQREATMITLAGRILSQRFVLNGFYSVRVHSETGIYRINARVKKIKRGVSVKTN